MTHAAKQARVVFRVDANVEIGLGHVTRCLALAEMLKADFMCCFAMRQPATTIANQVQALGAELVTVTQNSDLVAEGRWFANQLGPTDLVVLDGYEFTAAYRRAIKQAGRPLVVIDDLLTQSSWADIVINTAGGVTASDVPSEPGALLCLGPSYALLRAPFREASQKPAGLSSLDTHRVFLNMGGADPDNQTAFVLSKLLNRFSSLSVEIVTGAAYPHQAQLLDMVANDPSVHLHHNLSAAELADLLARCNTMICSPSGMAYECCAVGGRLFLHLTAENQRNLFNFLCGTGLALPLASLFEIEDTALSTLTIDMPWRQRAVFDGQAEQRYEHVFTNLAFVYSLSIRRATEHDSALYYTWANDAEVRRNAVRTEPISWETHTAWFAKRLADNDSYLYLLSWNGEPVGQVRIDFEGIEGTIDYSVASAFRGKGLGAAVLRRTFAQLRLERPDTSLLKAQVKSTNQASYRVFQRLGFKELPAQQVHGEQYHFFSFQVPAST